MPPRGSRTGRGSRSSSCARRIPSRLLGRARVYLWRAGNAEAAPGGGSAPLRGAIASREEARQATWWIRASVRSPAISVGTAEAAGLLHPTQEQELVELLERPLEVVGRQPADERRQAGGLSRGQALHQEEPVDRASGRSRGSRRGESGSASRRVALRRRPDGGGATSGRGDRTDLRRRRTGAR